MNLSEPFIRRPVMTSLLMLAILVFGIMAYNQLPVSDLPNVDYPTITVRGVLPGASPETMANTVATPLEKAFTTISGVNAVTSSNTQGSTSIIIQFDLSRNIDSASGDVQAAISKTLPLLPKNMPSNPTYEKVNPSQSPIIYLCLTSSTMNMAQLFEFGNLRVAQRLSLTPGVAQVATLGAPYAVRVQVDPNILAVRGIDLLQVSNAINEGNPSLPTGTMMGENIRYILESNSELINAAGYNPLVITYEKGAPVRIQDIGQAIDSLSDNKFYMHFIDQEVDQTTVVLAVSRQPGANTVKVAQAVKQYLPELRKELPESVDLKVIFDKSITIEESVTDVKFTMLLALVLVVTVIFLYLGKFADTIIPSTALPLTIVGTFAVMYFLDFSIDNLSLLALILAIGFIIDDAIVVLENIVRHTEMGEMPFQAAINGSRQISVTILTMTLSLSAVFIPMLFMSGIIGKIFNEFAVTIVVAILFSGLISLTLTPMLSSRFVPARNPDENRQKNLSERLNAALLQGYMYLLTRVLKHRFITLLAGILCIIATIIIFRIMPTDFIPSDDTGFVIGYSQAADSTSAKNMIRHQTIINEIFKNDPNIDQFVSIAATPLRSEGQYFIKLKPIKERKPINQLIANLNPQLQKVPGINTYLKGVPLIDLSLGASKGDYQYVLQSLDIKMLFKYAQIMFEKMQTIPELSSVISNLKIRGPQINIVVLRDRAATYGLTAQNIETALLLSYAGGKVSTILLPSAQYDVILELLPQYQQNADALNTIYLRSPLTGEMVPLTSVAKWNLTVGPLAIDHLNQFPSVVISFSMKHGVALGDVIKKLNALAEKTLPPKVKAKVQGTAQVFEQTFANLTFLTLVALIVIYLVLGTLYESFILPFTVMSALPVAGLGALITLMIFGEPLSLYAFVGLIMLIGIVQKNGIMMIDHANHVLETPGKTSEDAIIEACRVRFRPIIMTTIAAIMGALPIALGIGVGAAARRPLGLVVVGGLIFSQLITLFVTPVVYLYFERLQIYLQNKLPLLRGRSM